MASTIYDITILEGTDLYFTTSLQLVNADCSVYTPNISGDSFSGTIVNNYNDKVILATLNCSVINASGGVISVSLPASGADSITTCITCIDPNQRVMDLGFYTVDWYSATTLRTNRLLEGSASFSRSANYGGVISSTNNVC